MRPLLRLSQFPGPAPSLPLRAAAPPAAASSCLSASSSSVGGTANVRPGRAGEVGIPGTRGPPCIPGRLLLQPDRLSTGSPGRRLSVSGCGERRSGQWQRAGTVCGRRASPRCGLSGQPRPLTGPSGAVFVRRPEGQREESSQQPRHVGSLSGTTPGWPGRHSALGRCQLTSSGT